MKSNYSKALIELRSKLDVSQTELAERLGVSYPSVNRWENDKAVPVKIVRVRIEKLCKDNGIDIEEVD